VPWKVRAMSEIRLAVVQEVVALHQPLAPACRKYGIRRTTGYTWPARDRRDPAQPLRDQSRRPARSPGRTAAALEEEVLQVRDRFGGGAPKIWASLRNQAEEPGRARALPCEKTIGNILRRRGRTAAGPAGEAGPPQFFARPQPNELWPCDFKGPVEVERRTVHPFTALDDHSRSLLALTPCPDVTMRSAWGAPWEAFGAFGLPEARLCDNAFGTQFTRLPGLSWFAARPIRLGVNPSHGRPYHPQTQGTVERRHGTLEAEVWPHVDRATVAGFAADLRRWRTQVYNAVRPHEALGGRPPVRHDRPSPRRRPAALPEAGYEPGAVLRRVSTGGDIRWHGSRVLVGAGLAGEAVRVEERDRAVAVSYGWKQVRRVGVEQLRKDRYV
jgi:Integrase core domain/leucine-zipper of insertion element IS481